MTTPKLLKKATKDAASRIMGHVSKAKASGSMLGANEFEIERIIHAAFLEVGVSLEAMREALKAFEQTYVENMPHDHRDFAIVQQARAALALAEKEGE